MSKRINIEQVAPKAFAALLHLESYLATVTISKKYLYLIKIRASQINGCAYCIDMHMNHARNEGETQQRLDLLVAWKEAKNIFSLEECLLLAATEEITLLHRNGLTDAIYNKLIEHFGDQQTVEIIMTIITINSWNRLTVSLKKEVD